MVDRAIDSFDDFEAGVIRAADGLKDNLAPAATSAKDEIAELNDKMDKTISLSDMFNTMLMEAGEGALDFGSKVNEAAEIEAKAREERLAAERAALEERLANIDLLSAKRIAAIERDTLLHESAAAKEKSELKKKEAAYEAVAMAMAMSMSAGFKQMILDSENASKHILLMIIDVAEKSIMAYAASSAAAAAFSQAGIPIIGPIAAIAASGLIFGLVKALASRIPKAAMGGVMSSGVFGQDTQPVLTQRGEGILKTGQTNLLQRLADRLEQSSVGGSQPAMAGASIGGNTSIVNFNSVHPATSAEALRATRAVDKQRQRLARLGMA